MRKILALLSLLASTTTAHAAGGFFWFQPVTAATQLPNHVVTFMFVGFLFVVVALLYRAKIARVDNVIIPDRGVTLRNFIEMYGKFIYSQAVGVMGEKDASKYFQFVASIFLMIWISNLLGLVPGFLPPTEFISTTLALGLFSFIYYNVKGCKELGVINYLKHFAGPIWYMAILIFPIEILSNLVRPVSLALRLQGNMMGDHKVLATFLDLEVLGFPIAAAFGALPAYALGILVCTIQAYVFTMLSMVYISLAISHHDHDEDH
jgi:F-type H+-transporting ATPase subunit a